MSAGTPEAQGTENVNFGEYTRSAQFLFHERQVKIFSSKRLWKSMQIVRKNSEIFKLLKERALYSISSLHIKAQYGVAVLFPWTAALLLSRVCTIWSHARQTWSYSEAQWKAWWLPALLICVKQSWKAFWIFQNFLALAKLGSVMKNILWESLICKDRAYHNQKAEQC